ncbi:MAG: hypothetical protein JSS89_08175 [Bacteroidetes bacterium]|nr:hypothetical protein [Bacteroidota bacterium]
MSALRSIALLFSFLSTIPVASALVLTTETVIMPQGEVDKLFTDSLTKAIGINHPIRRVYRSTDRTGVLYTVLAESIDSITIDDGQDTIHRNIQAVMCRFDSTKTRIVWSMKDHTRVRAEYDAKGRIYYEEETSIYFWTRYCSLDDVDNDGKVDLIIVYGGNRTNGIGDARVVITLYHRGKRYSIRHQNGSMDSERHSQVDKRIYSLAPSLRNAITSVMKRMEVDRTCIFPVGWESAFRRGTLLIHQPHQPWNTD